MVDVHTQEQRSRNMSAIRGGNTKPELVIRKALHAAGLRYRLHVKQLPGKPDLVFPQYKAVVFVNGCFWHQHGCHLFKWPTSREDFWKKKITRNVQNDNLFSARLLEQGWRVATLWECALKGRTRRDHDEVIETLKTWIKSSEEIIIIQGI